MFLEDQEEWLIHSKCGLVNFKDVYDLGGRGETGGHSILQKQPGAAGSRAQRYICPIQRQLASPIDGDRKKKHKIDF
jgi:hypothetical protein